MADKDRYAGMLRKAGALWLHGGGSAPHALLTSGKHSNGYINMTKVVERPDLTKEFCEELAGRLNLDKTPDVVVGSAMGAITIAYQVAAIYGGETRAAYTEKIEGALKLKRFEVKAGERALVIEDTMTTGGTTVKTIQALLAAGADVLPVCGVLVNRSGADALSVPDAKSTYPITAVVSLDIETWDAAECPLCRAGSEALRPKENWPRLVGPAE
ncbi:MAG: phosphoribosyltransferase family protein [Planctomycetota bacterium]|jgi:orotate phosphoribosyltransferase